MSKYLFEKIEYSKKLPINVFFASVEYSSFHWHYEYEVMMVLKGSVLVTTKNGARKVTEGNIVMFNSKEFHEITRLQDENICFFVQFDNQLFIDSFEKNRNYQFILDSTNTEIPLKYGKTYNEFTGKIARFMLYRNSDNNITIKRTLSYIHEFVADVFEYAHYDIVQVSKKTSESMTKSDILELLEYVDGIYKEENIIEKMCVKFAVSEKTLYRYLKDTLGITVKELIVNKKIEEAKKLLKNTSYSITLIGTDCGFKSEMTFYRTFKKVVGVTPKEYRDSGGKENKNPLVCGYLEYNTNEAIELLRKYKEYKVDFN